MCASLHEHVLWPTSSAGVQLFLEKQIRLLAQSFELAADLEATPNGIPAIAVTSALRKGTRGSEMVLNSRKTS